MHVICTVRSLASCKDNTETTINFSETCHFSSPSISPTPTLPHISPPSSRTAASSGIWNVLEVIAVHAVHAVFAISTYTSVSKRMASTLSSTDSRKTSDTQISKPPSLQDRIKNRLCKLKPPKSPKPRTSEKISSSVFPLNLPYNGSFRKLPNSQGSKWSKKCQGLVVETLHQWMEVPVKYEWQSDESMPGQVVTETVKSRWR
ncbi:hypothetical protein FPQ18DRAFT_415121 [Pyronema domesticum]|nr:hypothetical protein FPQ18DRAFT_415121 [Pyronema domesticum]